MKRAGLVVVALVMVGVTPAMRAEAAPDTTGPGLWVAPFAPFAVGHSIGPSAEATPQSTTEVYTWDIDQRPKWHAWDPSGICGYDVDVVRAGLPPIPLWRDTMRKWVRTDLGTDYDGTFGAGSSVATGVQVTAYDCAGNSTVGYSSIQALVSQEDGSFTRPLRPQEVTFTYKGKWKTSNYSGFSGGHTRKTTAKGASVEIDVVTDVKGEHLALVMEKAPNRGKAKVFVDGKYKKTINTYAKTTKHRVIVFDTWLSAGPHTIKVVNMATQGHPRIDIDAVLTHDTYTTPQPTGGSIVGWGYDFYGQATPPAGNDYTAIAAGHWHNLALKTDGSIVGWGYDFYGQATPPAGNDYTAIAAGHSFGLALKTDGTIVGWGDDHDAQATPPVGNDYTAIAAGNRHSLALRTDGSIVGWGYNGFGQATPPAGNDYTAIAAGWEHSLALKADGSIVAWGGNQYGAATAPAGDDYTAIAAGDYHGLALKADGSIVAWGYDFYGQATPPAGNDYTAIAAGFEHSLALKTDGTIVGWGDSNYGAATPPAGSDYTAIAARGTDSLALTG